MFRRHIIATGNAQHTSRPHFSGFMAKSAFSAASETIPATHGPSEQPRSPNMASIANIGVPPFGKCFAERLNTPGHIIATDMPHIPQPTSGAAEPGARVVIR